MPLDMTHTELRMYGAAQVGVRNLRFSGRIRITLSGLMNQVPIVSIAKVRSQGSVRIQRSVRSSCREAPFAAGPKLGSQCAT